MKFSEFKTKEGQILLHTGNPDLNMLNILAVGPGDCWHSSFEQGYKNAFQDLSFQTHTAWWYINDFDHLDQCVSWRINPHAFVIRKSVWETTGGFDKDYDSAEMQGLALGYDLIGSGGIPMYVKGLFSASEKQFKKLPVKDQYVFFRKKFKPEHSMYMLLRKGIWKPKQVYSYCYAKIKFQKEPEVFSISAKPLQPLIGRPTVSYIIPTMMRQEFTEQLLVDLSAQTYLPTQVVVVDATPENERIENSYNKKYPFELIVKWQTSKGSCRARNEAIAMCIGEYIVFGDDDIRVPRNFIENHVRLLQTYHAGACNGWDVRAENQQQTLDDLYRLQKQHPISNKVGLTSNFSNANSCVKKVYVDKLIGNDVNYDGGYGEDGDFGMSLSKIGVTVLFNPYSSNLHLKPPNGGYRWWGSQSRLLGKKRKKQPWELGVPVKWIHPVPSPTIMYSNFKHYNNQQRKEYKYKYLLYTILKGSKLGLIWRLIKLPYRILQYKRSVFYAKRLIARGIQYV